MASAAARVPAVPGSAFFVVLLALLLTTAGCGILRTELGDIVEPPPGTVPTVPIAGVSPPAKTEVTVPGQPSPVQSKELTAEASAVAQAAPIVLSGGPGTTSTPLDLPLALHRARITYAGGGPITMKVSGDDREQVLLEDEDGYEGSVPLSGIPGGSLDCTAGGAWTVEIVKLGTQEDAAFTGAGDAVSDLFKGPAPAPWRITHQGEGPFSARLQCVGGDLVVFENTGPLDVTQEITFPKNLCVWIVKASGAWSLTPAN